MKKPITQRFYCSVEQLQPYFDKLNSLGVEYTVNDIFSTFNGYEIVITRPTGKGSQKKSDEVYRILYR